MPRLRKPRISDKQREEQTLRRLRLLGARMECENLSDVLLTMIDAQSVIELEEENKVEMNGSPMFDDRGRPIKYGARTKAHGWRTPDSVAMDQRIKFDTDDREAAEKEASR